MQSNKFFKLVSNSLIKDPLAKDIGNTLQPIVEAGGDSKVFMIGESTHGTEEYYHIRAELTKKLIVEKGFNVVAIEADFSDVERVNRYVTLNTNGHKPDSSALEALGDFARYPKWMWRNYVFHNFVEWLREYNSTKPLFERTQIFGMDLYSIYTAAQRLITFFKNIDEKDTKLVEDLYSCILKYKDKDPHLYGYDVASGKMKSCEENCLQVLLLVLDRAPEWNALGLASRHATFAAQQNARLVYAAEQYYKIQDSAESWNRRDHYMFETIESVLIEFQQTIGIHNPKLVTWSHSSHIADTRANSFGNYGETNVGTLIRQKYGFEHTFSVGFSTFNGTVTASNNWGGPTTVFRLRNADKDSYSYFFHNETNGSNFYAILRNSKEKVSEELLNILTPQRSERNVGVQYKPNTERGSHYSTAVLTKEFDAMIHIDKTNFLKPIDQIATLGNEN